MSNQNLTPEHTEALNAVNLRLHGITHGYKPRGEQRLIGITDYDYTDALSALDELDVMQGDRLAIEFNGPYKWTDGAAHLAHIVPATIPDMPLEAMPSELKAGISHLLEQGRNSLQINNIVYTAAQAALRGFAVHMADSRPEEWQAFNTELEAIVPDTYHKESQLYFRNSKMLTRLGDIAIEMAAQPKYTARRPVLLFLSGLTHTKRIADRLAPSDVWFTSNLDEVIE